MADNKYLLPGSTTMIRIVNIDIERQGGSHFLDNKASVPYKHITVKLLGNY